MFRIRAEQRTALRTAAVADFVDRAAAHARRFFPERAAALGAGLEDEVRFAITRAARYGVVAERDVCKFLDLQLVFGRDFDVEAPWAREILADPRFQEPVSRLLSLHERGLEAAAAAEAS